MHSCVSPQAIRSTDAFQNRERFGGIREMEPKPGITGSWKPANARTEFARLAVRKI